MTDAPPTTQRSHPPDAAAMDVAANAAPSRAARFDALVANAGEAIARYLYGMTGDHAAAEDLAQEVFLRAWTHLDTLREPASARSWLFAIAANTARRHLRRAHRFGWLPLEALPLAAPRLTVDGSDDLPDEAIALERALGHLRADDRAVLLLVGAHDLTMTEAAGALGISAAAAKKRWQRACARFRMLMPDGRA
ncbi:MAG: RNA polymerase sigma factor [Ardenticatenales bacterium]